jgi:hypothetical protein
MDLNEISTALILIPGYEVTTYKGHWNIWGDGRWIDFRVTSEADMTATIQAALEAGYLTSCNHPRPYGPDWVYTNVEGYACVEVWNGPWEYLNETCLNFWETRLKQGKRLVAVGGSDKHRLRSDEAVQLAQPMTYIYCQGEPSAAGLLGELRAGHAFITCAPDGPQLHLTSGSAMMGDYITRPSNSRLTVQVEVVDGNEGLLEICTAQGITTSQRITEHQTHLELDVDVTDTPYVRAQLRDAKNNFMLALTNPIYVEV